MLDSTHSKDELVTKGGEMSSQRRNSWIGCFWIIVGLLIVFIPFASTWLLSNECGPVRVWQFRREADLIFADIIEAEKLVDQTGQMPTYMDTKLNQDVYQIGYMTVPTCAQPAAVQLSCALTNGRDYLSWKPVAEGQIVQDMSVAFEGCMSQYYFEIAKLDRCWPFCSSK